MGRVRVLEDRGSDLVGREAVGRRDGMSGLRKAVEDGGGMDDSELTLIARWCVDAETGERKLLDLRTGKDITPREKTMDSLPKDWMDGYDAGYAASERELNEIIEEQDDTNIRLVNDLDLVENSYHELEDERDDLANRVEMLTATLIRIKSVLHGLDSLMTNEIQAVEESIDAYGDDDHFTGIEGLEDAADPFDSIESADYDDEVPF
jgi:hypothetical protein